VGEGEGVSEEEQEGELEGEGKQDGEGEEERDRKLRSPVSALLTKRVWVLVKVRPPGVEILFVCVYLDRCGPLSLRMIGDHVSEPNSFDSFGRGRLCMSVPGEHIEIVVLVYHQPTEANKGW
jgi:hypothetical protein